MSKSQNKNIILNLFITLIGIVYLFKIEGEYLYYNNYFDQPEQNDVELLSDQNFETNINLFLGVKSSKVDKCDLNFEKIQLFNEYHYLFYNNQITTLLSFIQLTQYSGQTESNLSHLKFNSNKLSEELPAHSA